MRHGSNPFQLHNLHSGSEIEKRPKELQSQRVVVPTIIVSKTTPPPTARAGGKLVVIQLDLVVDKYPVRMHNQIKLRHQAD